MKFALFEIKMTSTNFFQLKLEISVRPFPPTIGRKYRNKAQINNI